MATKEAALRLKWDQASFSSQVKTSATFMGKAFGAAGAEIGAGIKKSIGAGIGAAKQSISGLSGHLKGALGTAMTLGGAVSIGSFVKQAISAEEQAGAVAMQLRRMHENGASANSVIEEATTAAHEFNGSLAHVLDGYKELLAATGDPVFTREAIGSVVEFAHAFRITEQGAAGLISTLHEKLGLSAEQIRTEMGPAILDVTNKGGVGIEDLQQNLGSFLALMPALGLAGADGFRKLVGLLNMTDDAGGEVSERMTQMQSVLIKFRSENFIKTLSKDLHGLKIDKNADALERFQAILSKKGGAEVLEKVLGASPRTAKIFAVLMQPFTTAVDEAVKAGATKEESLRVGAQKFRDALEDATSGSSTEATLKEEAAKRAAEKSQRMERALDRMAESFTKPEILDSLDKLAAALPPVADAFSKLVKMAVENPVGTAAGAIGAKVGLDVGMAMIGSAGGSVLAKGGALATKGAAALAPEGVLGGVAASGGAAAAATMAAAAVAAGAVGYGVGEVARRYTIDPEQKRQMDALTTGADEALMEATSAGSGRASIERKKAALRKISAARESVESTRGGVTDFLNDMGSRLFGAQSPEEMRRKKLTELSDAETALAVQIQARIALEEKLARASSEAAKALDGTSKSARGVRRPADPLPGSATPD